MSLVSNITTLIPQRAPFVMLDELLYCDSTTAETSFIIAEDNVLVINGEFTEAGIMENLAQTAAANAGYAARESGQPVSVGYIGAVRNFEILRLPRLNDQIKTLIKIENQIFDATIISGSITCNGELIAKCEMNIFINK